MRKSGACGVRSMSESEALFGVLRQSADADAWRPSSGRSATPPTASCAASTRSSSPPNTASTRSAPSPRSSTPRDLGLFELSWNVLCPGCGGVLDAGTTLKTINREEYDCGLCASGYKPTLDEMVEVTFTVSPRRSPHRRAQSGHAARGRIFPPDFLVLAASICPMTWTTRSRRSPSIRSSCRRARRRCCRCSCRAISSSCSIR